MDDPQGASGNWPATDTLVEQNLGTRIPPNATARSGEHRARRAGPREHGRQAARSKRDRPERARERKYRLSHIRAAAGGA